MRSILKKSRLVLFFVGFSFLFLGGLNIVSAQTVVQGVAEVVIPQNGIVIQLDTGSTAVSYEVSGATLSITS